MYPPFIYHRSITSFILLGVFLFFSSQAYLYAKTDPTEPATEETITKNTDTKKIEKDNLDTKNLTDEEKKVITQKEENIAKIRSLQQALELLRSEIDSSREDSSLNSNKVKAIKTSFNSLENKLKDVLGGMGNNSESIDANIDAIKEAKLELTNLLRSTRANLTDIGTQKSMIEDNSIRLYETLVKIDSLSKALENKDASKEYNDFQATKKELYQDMQKIWVLVSILFVSLAPLAYVFSSNRNRFTPLKDGTPHSQGIILVCVASFLAYFVVGFSLMYGMSSSGWIGISNYLLQTKEITAKLSTQMPFAEFIMYQSGFVILSVLIVYTAIGRYLSASLHILLAIFVGTILVPIFGHWAWASNFITSNKGWLENIGFIDQSGSTIIHAVAAWFAFIIIRKLGDAIETKERKESIGNFPVYSSSAALLLWISWQGFTTGTLPVSDSQISSVMLNNFLAACAGGMMASLHYIFFHAGKGHIIRGLSGFISGMVAISACAQIVTFAEAILIGAVAGLLQNIAFNILHKYFLKGDSQIPAAYLVSIHGIAGIWGTLCVALLGTEGMFSAINTIQLIIQLKGIVVALVYSLTLGTIVAIFLKSKLKKQALKAKIQSELAPLKPALSPNLLK